MQIKKLIKKIVFSIIFCLVIAGLLCPAFAQRDSHVGLLIEDGNSVDQYVNKVVFNGIKTTVSTTYADATMDMSIFVPSTAQTIDATGDVILANAIMVVIDASGDDFTMASTPTIANGTTGQILYITCANGETNKINVRDQDTLAGSNLQLSDTSHDISGKDVLTLIFDGSDWIEQSYTNN